MSPDEAWTPPINAKCGEAAREACLKRVRALLDEQPALEPEGVRSGPYLIHPPWEDAASERFIAFRDRTLIPMVEAHPDDLFLRGMLEGLERRLAWRETVPDAWRFWRDGSLVAFLRRRCGPPAGGTIS